MRDEGGTLFPGPVARVDSHVAPGAEYHAGCSRLTLLRCVRTSRSWSLRVL